MNVSGVSRRLVLGCAPMLLAMMFVLVRTSSAAEMARQGTETSSRDLSGVWWNSDPGPLRDGSGTPDVALTAEGRKQHESNVASLRAGEMSDAAISRCLPMPMPRAMASKFPFQIVQRDKMLTFIHEENHQFWTVVVDGKLPLEDDIDPSFVGSASVGRWEGDTLVVETRGFKPNSLLDPSGIPHSDALQVRTRLHRVGRKLEAEFTMTDPGFFAKPWVVRRDYVLRPDVQLMEYVCGESHRWVPSVTSSSDLPVPARRLARPAKSPDFSGVYRRQGFPPAVKDLSLMMPWVAMEVSRRQEAIRSGRPLPSTVTQCLPAGPMTVWYDAHGVQLLDADSEVIVFGETDHQVRHILMNASHPANLLSTWSGHSVGRWEGSTLVVDTVGFNGRTTVDTAGTPHTVGLHLVEHISRLADGKSIKVEIVADDSGAFLSPWKAEHILVPKDEAYLDEYACAENNKDDKQMGAVIR